jgi:molybdate transport system substrate-binding protein
MEIIKQRSWIFHFALISIILCKITACVGSADKPQLFIAAAASLTSPFTAISEEFTEKTGIAVTFTFASTGNLAQQVRNGAPYDIFAAADPFYIDQLIGEKHLSGESRTPFAEGSLVFVFAPGYTPSLDATELLLDPDIRRIVIANPEHAPYGLAARQYLLNTGVWDSIQDKLVFSENVRQAAQVVLSGNASAGIIAKSTAVETSTRIFQIDRNLHNQILHVAAISQQSPLQAEALQFLAFLASNSSVEILSNHGLDPERIE